MSVNIDVEIVDFAVGATVRINTTVDDGQVRYGSIGGDSDGICIGLDDPQSPGLLEMIGNVASGW